MPETDENETQEETGVATGLRNLLQRHNNQWATVAAELYSQTGKLREDRRTLRAELEQLKAKVPAEDDVVLSGKDKETYEAYKALGTPEEINSERVKAAETQRNLQVSKLATKHSLKESVLTKLLSPETEILLEGTGEDAVYKLKNGDKTATVEEMLSGEWSDFAPSLQAETQPDHNGTRVLVQSGSKKDAGKDKDMVESFLQSMTATPKKEEA